MAKDKETQDTANVTVDEVKEDEKVEEAEAADVSAADAPEPGPRKRSRAEQKARKAIAKLNLKPVPNINRVAIKRTNNVLFVIADPEVYQAGPNAYVIFGIATIDESTGADAAAQAAQAFASEGGGMPGGMPGGLGAFGGPGGDEGDDDMPDLVDGSKAGGAGGDAAAGDGGDADESGLEATDIELVMSQTNVSRAKATAALKKNKGDIVNAIMELTM